MEPVYPQITVYKNLIYTDGVINIDRVKDFIRFCVCPVESQLWIMESQELEIPGKMIIFWLWQNNVNIIWYVFLCVCVCVEVGGSGGTNLRLSYPDVPVHIFGQHHCYYWSAWAKWLTCNCLVMIYQKSGGGRLILRMISTLDILWWRNHTCGFQLGLLDSLECLSVRFQCFSFQPLRTDVVNHQHRWR